MASFCQALRYGREVRKTRSREKLKDRRDLGTGLRRKKMPVSHWYRHPCFWASLLGQFFFLLFSLSYTYLLSCILFLFALLYFVNYAPLLRALCKFGYSLLSPPFFTRVLRVYQCNSVRGSSFFSRFPWPPTLVILSIWSAASFSPFSSISFCSGL